MKFVILLALAFIFGANGMASEDIDVGTRRSVEVVSFINLIADPEDYLGKSVGVYGVFIQQGLESYIYNNRFAVESNNLSEVFSLTFDSEVFDEPVDELFDRLHNKIVFIEAKFEKTRTLGGVFNLDISRVKTVLRRPEDGGNGQKLK